VSQSWKTVLQPSRSGQEVKILVRSAEGDDLLKACLPASPSHPRALLTLLEGLALWTRPPLTAVIFAIARCPHLLDLAPFAEALWPTESALVQFEFQDPRRAQRRITGVGDFRQLRLV
jgi:hypothetical protein